MYSFGIIIQEIHTREGPWSTSYLEPCNIIERLKKVECPPFRPHVPQLIEKAEPLRNVMKRCWDEDADTRPAFQEIQKGVKMLSDNFLDKEILDDV